MKSQQAGAPETAEKPTLKLSPQQFGKIVDSLRLAGPSGGNEKRRFNRMEVEAKLALAHLENGHVGKSYNGLTKDISVNGIGFIQSEEIKRGDSFLAHLPCGKEDLLVACRATFCRQLAEGIFGVGAEFTATADPKRVAQKPATEGGTIAQATANTTIAQAVTGS